jgi:serine/threonine protein kinase
VEDRRTHSGASTSEDDATLLAPASSGTLQPGCVLRERFRLERRLGEGGMSTVFLATDLELRRHVAIKVLGEGFKSHPQALATLRDEVAKSQRLSHENIVSVYHFDRDGDHIFMVMEYMRGQSLETFLHEHVTGVPFNVAWPIIRGCARALAHMHERKIIHSDFKPANVFLTEDGGVKVLDLGIARTIASDETQLMGGGTRFDAGSLGALTPQYASCEMFDGLPPDQRDDIYALGCVAYELLVGRHPFGHLSAIDARAQQLVPPRPAGLKTRQWRAVGAALAFARADRLDTAERLIHQMDPARRPFGIATVLSLAGTMVVGLGLAYWFWPTPPTPDEDFIAKELRRYADNEPGRASREKIALWLEQSQTYLDKADQALAQGDLDDARCALQDCMNSARWVLGELLRGRVVEDPDELGTAKQLLRLSKSYLTLGVGYASAGQFADGIEMICQGLELNPLDPALWREFDELKDRVGDVKRIKGCGSMQAKRSEGG